MKTGIELITIERKEQIEKHGYTAIEDERNESFQLSDAAAVLCINDPHTLEDHECLPFGWDSERWQKMFEKPYKERLIIAGALIAAEIDRLQNKVQ